MGIDHAECRILRAEMHQHADEQGVLEDIGEVSGMKGVAIVQGRVLR